MKQQGHIQTAIKALQRQLRKLEIDHDKWETAENTARQNKDFFEVEFNRIKHEIQELESLDVQKELEVLT